MDIQNKKSIFVIEDSKEIRNLLVMVYSGEGYTVDCAINGRDALEKLQSMTELPGLILLDLMMPVMNGAEFRSAQMQDPRLAQIPVNVMTADSEVHEKSESMAVAGSLRKPFTIDTLLDVAVRYCH
mgnify:CR=1 FL=1